MNDIMHTHSISLIGRRNSNEDKHKTIINLDGNNSIIKNLRIGFRAQINSYIIKTYQAVANMIRC